VDFILPKPMSIQSGPQQTRPNLHSRRGLNIKEMITEFGCGPYCFVWFKHILIKLKIMSMCEEVFYCHFSALFTWSRLWG